MPNLGSMKNFMRGDSFYHPFAMDSPSTRNPHINCKEVVDNVLAARHWGLQWANQHVITQSNSSTAVSIINKDTCKHLGIVISFSRSYFGYLTFQLSYQPVIFLG